MIRNLLYNCFASTWSDEWRLNVKRLCQYADVFSGRRIVLVKTGEETVNPREVADAFDMEDVEFVRWPNDPTLQEVAGFVETIGLLQSNRSDEATFYAHTKGTKYRGWAERHMAAIRQWRNAMYAHCLSDPKLVDQALTEHACAGCFRIPYPAAPLPLKASWHFAGTFWWVRHDKLFSHPNWRDIHQSAYGVEGYLGRLFDISESECLFWDRPKYSLYSTVGTFECGRCGHIFDARIKMKESAVKVCPKCFKRRANFVVDVAA